MINKNIYLIAAILLFVPLVVIFFQNATMGYVMAFMFNIAASVTSSFWPIVIMSGLMGASITLYIQGWIESINDSRRDGGLDI